MKSDNWWINAGDYDGIECEDIQQTVPDVELLQAIITPLKIAKQKAKNRKDTLATAMNFDEYDGIAVQMLNRGEYQWLKFAGNIDNLDLNHTLLHIYEHLQRIAVGIQKALEHSATNQRLVEVLTGTKDDLRAILSEVQRALFEKNIPTDGRNVTKGIVPNGVIGDDESSRYIYNLTVFRHYLEALERVIQVLEEHRNRVSWNELFYKVMSEIGRHMKSPQNWLTGIIPAIIFIIIMTLGEH